MQIMHAHREPRRVDRLPNMPKVPSSLQTHVGRDYLQYTSAQNVLYLESLGYDIFVSYVFLSAEINVHKSNRQFAYIKPTVYQPHTA